MPFYELANSQQYPLTDLCTKNLGMEGSKIVRVAWDRVGLLVVGIEHRWSI